MFEKYIKLLNENLDWVKKQLKADKSMKNLKLARQICDMHKYRVVGMLELMQVMGEITWDKEFEERKKWKSCLSSKIYLKKLRKRERNELEQKKSTPEVGKA